MRVDRGGWNLDSGLIVIRNWIAKGLFRNEMFPWCMYVVARCHARPARHVCCLGPGSGELLNLCSYSLLVNAHTLPYRKLPEVLTFRISTRRECVVGPTQSCGPGLFLS